MKKILNGLGVFCSIILTFVLSCLIFIYAVILNVKTVVSEKGMATTFKKIDVVETLKTVEDGTMWEDFKQLGETLNLSEEQFEQILNSDKVKEKVGTYLGEVLSSSFNDKEANLTKEQIEEFLNIAVSEYNRISDTKISDTERQEILNSFDEEMITNINEELGSINLKETVEPEYIQYIELADNLLFGNYTLIILILIIIVMGLIVLFRFSFYKSISYIKMSSIISGFLLAFVGILILIIPLEDMEIIMPIRKLLATKVFITSGILLVLSIGLSIGKIYLIKYIDKNKENTTTKNEVKEEKNKKEKANKKIKEEKKIDKKTIIIIVLLLIILLIILFLVFGIKRSYTITFDTNGGSLITNIEVKNNEVVKLPEPPTKDGYKFVGWTNEAGKVITKGTKVTEDITLKAEWISDDAKTNIVEFNTDGGNEIDNIIIEKGNNILLPIEPIKDGYIFVGWLNENDNIIIEDIIVDNNIKLKAMWIKKDAKIATITFDTDGGSNIGNIIVENGKVILLPVNPIKTGYVFAGWVDQNGNSITKDTIVKENMTIKATWKEPYTCPSGCTPVGDGSKCTKTTTKDVVTYTGCPTGTETVEKFCSSHKWQVSIGFGEDMTYENAGILCSGNPTNFCVDYNNRYTTIAESCPSGYFKYFDSDGLGGLYGCAKKYNKGGSGCPSGYTKNGNKCIKTETLKCKAN